MKIWEENLNYYFGDKHNGGVKFRKPWGNKRTYCSPKLGLLKEFMIIIMMSKVYNKELFGT